MFDAIRVLIFALFFFFNDTATTEIYTLSLHDALPISVCQGSSTAAAWRRAARTAPIRGATNGSDSCRRTSRKNSSRSEEHTSELQSQSNLVCRLLLEKKKTPYSPALSPHETSPPHSRH